VLARIRLSVSRLVDGLGGPALSNAALLIEGDRIAEVGMEASVPRPEGCLVGTDGTDFQEAIHLELESFSAIGVDAVTTIRAATLDAARHLGIDALTGSLEPGKAADVLIVAGAADRDIRALRRPRLVVSAGRPVQPTPPPAWPGPLEW